MVFFSSSDISANLMTMGVKIRRLSYSQDARTYVLPVPSTSNTGFQPNLPVPRGGTILPSVRPSKSIGSVPGPALYAKVQSA